MVTSLCQVDLPESKVMTRRCPMCGCTVTTTLHENEVMGQSWSLERCHQCHLSFTWPIPTHDEMNAFYEGDYHQPLRTEGGTEKAFGEKYLRYAAALARHVPSGRVVDIGCSTGLMVKILSDKGYDAEGIELNEQSAKWGRAHYGVTIHTERLEDCGFERKSLDAFLMTDVLEHTQNPSDFLRDAGQWLKHRGHAVITFPDIESLESRYWYLMSKLLHRGWMWGNCHSPQHVWEFTASTAEACFKRAGFRIVEFRRHQSPEEEAESSLALRLLSLPVQPLSWSWLGRLVGTQMEFVIQKI